MWTINRTPIHRCHPNKERRLGTSWVQICCDYEVLRLWRSVFCLNFTNICYVYLFKETRDFSVLKYHGRKLLPRLGAFESLYYALDLNNESCHVTLEAQCFSDLQMWWKKQWLLNWLFQTNQFTCNEFEDVSSIQWKEALLGVSPSHKLIVIGVYMGASVRDRKHFQKHHILATTLLETLVDFPLSPVSVSHSQNFSRF